VLYGTHASHHEAVFWIAGRFDLLATAWTLAAVLLLTKDGPARLTLGLVCFAVGLLSKESALALPIVAVGYVVLVERRPLERVWPLVAGVAAVLAAYAVLRWQLAGLDPAGGASRLPKLSALVSTLAALLVVARAGWSRASRVLRHAAVPWLLMPVGPALATAAALGPVGAAFVREKLAFVGFAAFYLVSPVVSPVDEPLFLDAGTPVYWVGGLAALWTIGALLRATHRHWSDDGVVLWLLVFTAGALLPVSSMTEGQRYVYLASAGPSMLVALLGDRLPHRRRLVAAVAAIVAAVSVAQIQVKAGDWKWAGEMTARGTSSVAATLGDACDRTDVVLLTAPVGLRGVYSHLYRDSFALGGCVPRRVIVLARMVRYESRVEARWTSPRSLEWRVTDYRDNIVLSRDLRSFDVPLAGAPARELETSLGRLESMISGDVLTLRLSLADEVDLFETTFFAYTDGSLAPLGARPGPVSQEEPRPQAERRSGSTEAGPSPPGDPVDPAAGRLSIRRSIGSGSTGLRK
jgi:hypothetical protein